MAMKCNLCQGDIDECDSCESKLTYVYYCVDNAGHFCEECVHETRVEDEKS